LATGDVIMAKDFIIREMSIEDYEEVYKIWVRIPGVGITDADSKERISLYLDRNPNLSFVCQVEGKIVGTILCGHDGKRGYIQHTCVLPEWRGKNIGRYLVEEVVEELKGLEIDKCHLFVFADNEIGQGFWKSLGWKKRSDILIFSKNI
jgi:ribosomal protein S18 acetylase RimI-like enzyme